METYLFCSALDMDMVEVPCLQLKRTNSGCTYLFCSALDVGFGGGDFGEDARGFDDIFRASRSPLNIGGVTLVEHHHLLACTKTNKTNTRKSRARLD